MTEPAPERQAEAAWVKTWLSTPRSARYLWETGNDHQPTLALYEWNLQLGAALIRDIAHVEVDVSVFARAMANAVGSAASGGSNSKWRGQCSRIGTWWIRRR